MKKVLFITTHPALGGAQKWTYNQIQLLQSSYDVYLATGAEEWLTEASSSYCKKVWVDEGIYAFASLGYLFRLRKFVKENNIDLIIASSANAGLYARLLKLIVFNVAVTYVSHGWSAIYRGNKFHRSIEWGLSYLSNMILVVSKSDYMNAIDNLKISPSKLTLIENAIPPYRQKNKYQKGKDNGLDIVMVARFEIPKRQDLLLEAAKQLPKMHFHFVGDGPEKIDVQKEAPKNTTFWGELTNIEEVLQNADIFVLLSNSEGMPLSVLEALSYGKPIILSNIPSMQTFITDGNGILVDNNINCIVKALKEINDKNLKHMGESSKDIFDTRFNLENQKDVYLDYYASLV